MESRARAAEAGAMGATASAGGVGEVAALMSSYRGAGSARPDTHRLVLAAGLRPAYPIGAPDAAAPGRGRAEVPHRLGGGGGGGGVGSTFSQGGRRGFESHRPL